MDEALRLIREARRPVILAAHGVILSGARHSIPLGITRDAVIEIANGMGIEVEIRALMLDDLLTADEAFFTGTAVEVAAIRELEGQGIGSAVPGPTS